MNSAQTLAVANIQAKYEQELAEARRHRDAAIRDCAQLRISCRELEAAQIRAHDKLQRWRDYAHYLLSIAARAVPEVKTYDEYQRQVDEIERLLNTPQTAKKE